MAYIIEMAALKLLGDLLESSGWTGALEQAGVATAGTANSFLKASHVTRTRRAHQITASTLYILLHKAYNQYTKMLPMGHRNGGYMSTFPFLEPYSTPRTYCNALHKSNT